MVKIAFLSHLDWNLYLFRLSWMKALKNEGFDVYAIIPEGKYCDKLREAGIKVMNYRMNRRSLNPLSAISTIYAVYKIFKRERFNIVYTFTIKPNVYGAIAGWMTGIPVIVNCVTGLGYLYIGNTLKVKLLRFLSRILYSLAFRIADRVIFQNEDDFKELLSLFDTQKAIIISGTGVDTCFFSTENANIEHVEEVRKELGISEANIVVTVVARLLKSKGILEFLQMARELHRRHEETVFLVVGGEYDGSPDSIPLETLKEYGEVSFIKFLGERDDVREILFVTDIYVLPSYYREGIPRTVLEAMSMGKPVVTTDAPGCKETVVDGENGFLVPPKDVNALADAVERLLCDAELRMKMGIKGRKMVLERFSDEIITRRIIEVSKMLVKEYSWNLGV
ncbi:MAG: glycosyltransferase family 4 protein [Synergistetes bacterium]|nr:glycosyltransferase family 4 protein [Synergistota bacterium]